jgi:hypothetical protein
MWIKLEAWEAKTRRGLQRPGWHDERQETLAKLSQIP